MTSRNENYKLKVTIKHHENVTNDVLCEIILPKRLLDPVEIILRPTPQQSTQIDWPIEFSIFGDIKESSGRTRTSISANKVYYKDGSKTHWGNELSETVIIGEPIDLKITDFIGSHEKGERNIKGTFWITPNIMLRPAETPTYSFTGDVSVNLVRNFIFTLENKTQLNFINNYKYLESDNNEIVSFPELVAEFDINSCDKNQLLSFGFVDDFLMLTSFSARQRCVCLGWNTFDSSEVTRYYRRDIVIPEVKEKQGFLDTLIDVKDFESFINTAYDIFVKTEEKDLLRQAIHKCIGKENSTFESNYLRLFSALETLVLLHRKKCNIEFITDETEWGSLRKELKGFIKSHSIFSSNKKKRELLYEKLPELNRVSFSTAFNSFCKFYNIDLNDLWPIINRQEGISLADIRNKLVHGDTFSRSQQRALMSADEHLRWIVERSILSVLGWQYSKSKASQEFLAKNMAMYKEAHEDRKMLSE